MDYKCTHGHDRCAETYPNETCPYCECEESDLLTRLEAATGPDRELDAEIARALGWIQETRNVPDINGSSVSIPIWIAPGTSDEWRKEQWHEVRCQVGTNMWRFSDGLPHYTASIDDALRLVPDGWYLETLAECRGGSDAIRWFCELGQRSTVETQDNKDCRAPTAPLAICIAALAQEGGGISHNQRSNTIGPTDGKHQRNKEQS